MEEKILSEENIYLDKTLKVIDKKIDHIETNLLKKVDSIDDFKKNIQSAKLEMDNIEYGNIIENENKKVISANEEYKNLNRLKKSSKNPYFGRIDFIENNESEKIYVGLCGIEENFNFYIYDWRTPIASMFYNHGVGEASYLALDGQIKGQITLKRQFKFEDSKIKHYFDTNVNIDDPFLQDVLASASGEKMKNIVTTIQQEQNEVIRNVNDNILIVQGSAGSGKTSVALHRIAYLLYQKKDLNSNNIVIFSPNDVFSNYISDVLPELGENNVRETTFSSFSWKHLSNFKKLENYIEFSERYYKSDLFDKKNFLQIKSKLSDDFSLIIKNYIDKVTKEIYFTKDLVLTRKNLNIVGFEDYIITKEELEILFKERYSTVSLMNRLDVIGISISDKLGISYKKYSKMIKRMLKEIISRKLDIILIYNEIVTSNVFLEKFKVSGKKINTNMLNYEDIVPLLYLTFEMTEYPSNSYIRQVVIDEAQDYTKLQLSLLAKIFVFADFTILGDVNQTINPFYKYNTLEEIKNLFKNRTKYIELNKTYRSSYEIVEHNNKILGLTNSLAVRKDTNTKVLYKKDCLENKYKSIYKDILDMIELKLSRIAIITKNYSEADSIYNELKDLIDIKQVNSKEISNLIVLPVSIAKGLEFDGVIVYSDEKNKYKDIDKNLFYVACTRAQHKLVVYNQDM